jgi:hypothetical protein
MSDTRADPDKMATDNDDIIAEARDRLRLCIQATDTDRNLALEDLKFKNGEHWRADEVQNRDLDGRPCLTVNTLPATIHQVTNDIRQNRQSIHVHPVDDDADVDTAEVIEGMCRHIEYDSGADAAYDTATESAASIGFGFFRLITEYCDPMSFDQVMKIKRVRNPFTIYIDPAAQEADGSDMQYAFVTSKVSKMEFKRLYPKATADYDAIGRGVGDGATDWQGADDVRVAEYYRVEHIPATLVRLSDGKTQLSTDKTPLAPGVYPIDTRPTFVKRIMWFKLTGKEILERAQVPFDWIPVFPVYGDEIDIDGDVTRMGMIRNAKDPVRMYDYWLTSATEEIALRTKTPYIGALGQFEGVEEDWNNANTRSFSYLEYNPVTIDGSLAPAPQRQAPADVPSGYIAMAGIARDNIKAVTGIYDASLGNRSNETSGIAIKSRQSQGEIANFHIADNLGRAIRHLGRTMVSGFKYVYDTERVSRILGVDGSADHVKINAPNPNPEPDKKTGAIKRVLNDMTVGTYDVVVKAGPAYSTLREEAADQMVATGQAYPVLWEKAGDLIVKSFDWPGAEEIAERLAPPGAKDDDEDMVQTAKGPIPKTQAGQLIGQMDQALEQMQGELEKLESGDKQSQREADTRIEIARINAEAKLDDTELKSMVQLLLARIEPMLAHTAAVVAAADPEHPDTPAPIAQGYEQSPADMAQDAQQQAQQPAPDAGTAFAPEGASS